MLLKEVHHTSLNDLRLQNCFKSHTCLCSTAEEYQKLAFPASEFVLEGILIADEYEVWTPIPHVAELLFNCGRNGRTNEEIVHLKALSWRHSILGEERCGPSECVITLYGLIHLHQDLRRFSSLRKQLKGKVDVTLTFEISLGIYSKPTTVKVEIF